MNKTNLKNNLKQVGLEDTQIEVLNYLYDVKKATVLTIARESKIPRTNIYNCLSDLQKKNLVGEIYEDGQKFIIPEPVSNLNTLVSNKKELAKKAVELLEKEYAKTKQEAKIHYAHGIEGFKKFAERILEVKQKPVKAFIDIDSLSKLASSRYLINFNERRIRKRLAVQVIVSEGNKKFLEQYTTTAGNEKAKQWFKIIPGLGEFDMNLVVYDQNMIMFAPKDEGYCLHFESPGFAQTMNDMFDFMWKQGEWVR